MGYMNRRTCVMAFLGLGVFLKFSLRAANKPIELYVDLKVDPERENEMVDNYRKIFRPTISKQPGFVDVRLLKLRETLAGKGVSDSRFRLLISFNSEEERLQWIATDEHQRAWPSIERTLVDDKYVVLLYDAL